MHQTTAQPSPPPRSGTENVTLLGYVAIIIKHSRMIACFTIGSVVLAALVTFFMPDIYTARTMILPIEDDKGVLGSLLGQLGGLSGISGAGAMGGPTKADLYVTMLKSETVKDPIIDRFKLLEVYKSKLRVNAYSALDRNIVISTGKKDGVLSIDVNDKNPKRAAEIANAYVEELGRLAIRLNMTSAGKNRIYLEERISAAHTDLAKAEDALKSFQLKNKAVSVNDQTRATIEGVAQLRAQLAAQEVQLATFQRQFTESSQEVKTTKTTVANLREQIGKLEGMGVGSSSIPSVGSMPQLGQEYMRLMRDFKIQEMLVELLTKQYEMTKLSEVKDVSPFQVLQVAKTPERRSKPVRSKIVTITFILALVGSCTAVIVRANSKKKF